LLFADRRLAIFPPKRNRQCAANGAGVMQSEVRILAAGVALLAMTAQSFAGGNCYEQVRTPPTYRTVQEQVMVSPGASRVEVVPPIYGSQLKQVMVAPAYEKYHVSPPLYRTVTEKVLVSPARKIARTRPAIYDTVHRKVRVDDGGYAWEWRIINGRRILCKVKRPPSYRVVAETVMVQPARTVYEVVPAQYAYQERQVKVHNGHRERYIVPAQYDYVREQVLIRPAEKRVYQTPPQYRTVSRQVMVDAGHTGWQPVTDYCLR
jgi:hypothetical protein